MVVIKHYTQRLGLSVAEQFRTFSFFSTQSKLALRASFACIISLYLALYLQSGEPFWAAISAFIVISSNAQQSFDKCIQRVFSTIIGAFLGIIITHFLHGQPILFIACLWYIALISIYQFWMAKRYNYAWLIGGITLTLVSMSSWDAQNAQSIINIAAARSTDISIGVIVSYLTTLFLYPSRHNLKHSSNLFDTLNTQFDTLLKALQQSAHQNIQNLDQLDEFHCSLNVTLEQLLNHIDLLYIGQSLEEQSGIVRGKCTIVKTLADFLVLTFKQNLNNIPTEVYLTFYTEIQRLREVLFRKNKSIHNIQRHHHDCLNTLSNLIKKHTLQNNASAHTYSKTIQTLLDQAYTQLVNKTLSQKAPPGFHPNLPLHFFYTRHAFYQAALYASVGIFFPAFWATHSASDYTQIAISVFALASLDTEASNFKSFLRLTGCIAGTLFSILIMGVSTDNTLIMFSLCSVGAFFFLYLCYGSPSTSYFGIQGGLIFFLIIIHGPFPISSIEPGITRGIGITLGVVGLLIAQYAFSKINQVNKPEHLLKMARLNMHTMLSCFFPTKAQPYNATLTNSYTTAYTLTNELLKQHCEFIDYSAISSALRNMLNDIFLLYCYSLDGDQNMVETVKILNHHVAKISVTLEEREAAIYDITKELNQLDLLQSIPSTHLIRNLLNDFLKILKMRQLYFSEPHKPHKEP